MTNSSTVPPSGSSIGVLAGWGQYPIVVARALREQGMRVIGLGVKDHAPQELRSLCDDYHEVGLAKLGAAIRYFKRQRVTHATMAGKFHKSLLFQPYFLLRHMPDWRAMRTFFPHFISRRKDCKDDSLLGAVVDAFAEDGIHFAPATNFVPEVLVKSGTLTRRTPTSSEMKDIEFGWVLAKEIGRLDIGQAVAVKGQAVLAVEALEGTDRCIRRAGELCPQGGFTVVKVAKPRQDMRFDVPTIGMGTIQSLVESGAKVLAVEASKTILLDEKDVVALADRHGIVVVACEAPLAEYVKRVA